MKNENNLINEQYRLADIKRWQELDFVLGFEIKISNNPDKDCNFCKRLEGKYPKTFIWRGWHHGCKCFATPVLEDYFSEKRSADRVNRLKAALHGIEYQKHKPDYIIYLPKNFIDFYIENKDKWSVTPLFITENIELIQNSQKYYYGNNNN